jgi:NADPH:quinone reductase-like Zn-dependent oxidoreductase
VARLAALGDIPRMRRWIKRIAVALALLVVAGASVLAIALSRDTPCGAPPSVAAQGETIRAVTRRCYGPPDVLAVERIEKPVPADDQILVKVRAAAINPLEWHRVRGTPYIMRLGEGMGAPTNPRLGIDYAGEVVAVGAGVTRFKPGDAIFGGRDGALAEYVAAKADGSVTLKPANISFEQAAGAYVAGVTALQALRDGGAVRPGQKVLINGASGGVGTFAVQVAKAMGAEVTAVCSTRNVELVRSLGADHVVDYTRDDFTRTSQRYDVVMDNVVNRPLLEIRRILKPEGRYLVIGGGGPDANPWIGAFIAPIKAWFISLFVDQDLKFFLSHGGQEDVIALARLMAEGKVSPFVDRTYRLEEIQKAMRYLEAGRARGKVVLTME